jgi:hypothetical protein
MLGFVIKLACFDTCPKLSESKTVFNIFGSKIKEWWDRDQLLEDQVKPLIFVANTGESSNHLVNLIQMTINFKINNLFTFFWTLITKCVLIFFYLWIF